MHHPLGKCDEHIIHKAGNAVAKSNKTYDVEASNDKFKESSQEYDIAHNMNETVHYEQPGSPSLDGFEEMRYYGAAITPSAGSRDKRSFIRIVIYNNGMQ